MIIANQLRAESAARSAFAIAEFGNLALAVAGRTGAVASASSPEIRARTVASSAWASSARSSSWATSSASAFASFPSTFVCSHRSSTWLAVSWA